MCRLMCHPVRHISLDNKHGRQEEGRTAYGKKSSMGSENRQRSFRGNLKVLRDALNRSHLPSGWLSKIVDIFRKDCSCRRAADMQTERRRKATSTQRVPRLTQSNLGGTDRIMADFRNLREHLWRFSLPIELSLPYGSSCACRHRAPCHPSSVIVTSVSL